MVYGLRSWRSICRQVAGGVLLATLATSSGAGDGQVLHVGESTTLRIDGQAWALDNAASRQARLVSVKNLGASGAAQRFQITGLKAGQVTLVFRSGAKTYSASIDVLR